MKVRIFILVLLALVPAGCGYHVEKERPQTPVSVTSTFDSIEEVVFIPKCIRCHTGQRAPKAIDLTSYDVLMRGGSQGAIVIPGEPDKSPLYQVIRSGTMPQGGPMLSEPEITAVYDWIRKGAP